MHKHQLEDIKADYIKEIGITLKPYLNENLRVHLEHHQEISSNILGSEILSIYGLTPASVYTLEYNEVVWEDVPVEVVAEIYANLKSWLERNK